MDGIERMGGNTRKEPKDCEQRKVIIFKTDLLPISETFIRNQGDALKRYKPQYVGIFKTPTHPSLARESDTILYTRNLKNRILAKNALLTGRIRKFEQMLDDERTRPDLIHAHFLPSAMAIRESAHIYQVPLIVTVHGYDVTSFPRSNSRLGAVGVKLRRKAIAETLNRASRIIGVSGFIQEKAIELGAPPEKVTLHHIGTDITPLPSQTGERKYDLLFVGRLTEKKGVIRLLRALDIAAETVPIKAAIVGDGPLMNDVNTLAERSKAEVTLFGAQPHQRVHQLMDASGIFCLPSETASNGDSEGLGMVILEAMAHQLPVVATQHGGIPEAVLDGRTGLLSKEKDTQALADDIVRLTTDPQLASSLGQKGRMRLEKEFDINLQTKKLEDLYTTCLQ